MRFAAAFLLFLAGCASRAVYVHDTKSEQDFKIDSAQCQRETRRPVGTTVSPDEVAYRRCLLSLGWRRVKRY